MILSSTDEIAFVSSLTNFSRQINRYKEIKSRREDEDFCCSMSPTLTSYVAFADKPQDLCLEVDDTDYNPHDAFFRANMSRTLYPQSRKENVFDVEDEEFLYNPKLSIDEKYEGRFSNDSLDVDSKISNVDKKLSMNEKKSAARSGFATAELDMFYEVEEQDMRRKSRMGESNLTRDNKRANADEPMVVIENVEGAFPSNESSYRHSTLVQDSTIDSSQPEKMTQNNNHSENSFVVNKTNHQSKGYNDKKKRQLPLSIEGTDSDPYKKFYPHYGKRRSRKTNVNENDQFHANKPLDVQAELPPQNPSQNPRRDGRGLARGSFDCVSPKYENSASTKKRGRPRKRQDALAGQLLPPPSDNVKNADNNEEKEVLSSTSILMSLVNRYKDVSYSGRRNESEKQENSDVLESNDISSNNDEKESMSNSHYEADEGSCSMSSSDSSVRSKISTDRSFRSETTPDVCYPKPGFSVLLEKDDVSDSSVYKEPTFQKFPRHSHLRRTARTFARSNKKYVKRVRYITDRKICDSKATSYKLKGERKRSYELFEKKSTIKNYDSKSSVFIKKEPLSDTSDSTVRTRSVSKLSGQSDLCSTERVPYVSIPRLSMNFLTSAVRPLSVQCTKDILFDSSSSGNKFSSKHARNGTYDSKLAAFTYVDLKKLRDGYGSTGNGKIVTRSRHSKYFSRNALGSSLIQQPSDWEDDYVTKTDADRKSVTSFNKREQMEIENIDDRGVAPKNSSKLTNLHVLARSDSRSAGGSSSDADNGRIAESLLAYERLPELKLQRRSIDSQYSTAAVSPINSEQRSKKKSLKNSTRKSNEKASVDRDLLPGKDSNLKRKADFVFNSPLFSTSSDDSIPRKQRKLSAMSDSLNKTVSRFKAQRRVSLSVACESVSARYLKSQPKLSFTCKENGVSNNTETVCNAHSEVSSRRAQHIITKFVRRTGIDIRDVKVVAVRLSLRMSNVNLNWIKLPPAPILHNKIFVDRKT